MNVAIYSWVFAKPGNPSCRISRNYRIPCVPFFFKWLHPVGAKKHPYFIYLHLDNGEVDFLRFFG